MKEEYGSGFDGTPEQALKYAQDTPGQELEVKRLLKVIRNKKMSKILKTIKEVIKEKLLREQDTSGWKTKVTKNTPLPPPERNPGNELVYDGGWRVTRREAEYLKKLPPLPERNPLRVRERIKKQMNTSSYMDKSKK